MDQASGSHFKLVYSNWYTIGNESFPFSNGLHPATINWMRTRIESEGLQHSNIDLLSIREFDERYFYNDPTSGFIFRHSNFFLHFNKVSSRSNIVCEDNVNDTDIHYYPVEIECNTASMLTGLHRFTANGKDYLYNFAKTLSPKILAHIKAGKVKLLFVNLIDPSEETSTLQEIELELLRMGIPSTSIVFLQGNVRTDCWTKMQLVEGDISLYQTANEMDRYPYKTGLDYISDYVKESDLDPSVVRSKKFLSFNRVMTRPHRLAICYTALKHNLLNDGLFSFLYGANDSTSDFLAQLIDKDDNFDNMVRRIKELVPYHIDTHHLDEGGLRSFYTVTNNKKDLYEGSYLHITSETQFDSASTPFFSEKTWRPILNLQPFIYVGNYRALNKLHTLGFKTFHPFIDESYDNEPNPKKRFALIEQELLKFANMSIEQIHDWYYSITDILIHNQTQLYNYKNHNPICNLQDTN